jgi:hypothetical protein
VFVAIRKAHLISLVIMGGRSRRKKLVHSSGASALLVVTVRQMRRAHGAGVRRLVFPLIRQRRIILS